MERGEEREEQEVNREERGKRKKRLWGEGKRERSKK
jgi:hypothetical protein